MLKTSTNCDVYPGLSVASLHDCTSSRKWPAHHRAEAAAVGDPDTVCGAVTPPPPPILSPRAPPAAGDAGRGWETPMMLSRVTSAARAASDHPSVPSGRNGILMNLEMNAAKGVVTHT